MEIVAILKQEYTNLINSYGLLGLMFLLVNKIALRCLSPIID